MVENSAEADNTCWWYPNSPECQQTVVFDEDFGKPEPYSHLEVLMAQISFALVAVFEISTSSMFAFRYRSRDWTGSASDSYYKPYDTHVGGTNWWGLSSLISYYSRIAVYGVAFVFQMMAIFGLFPEINIYVWEWGIVIGMASLEVLIMLMTALGYDSATVKCREGITGACDVVDMIFDDLLVFFGVTAFSGVIVTMNWKMWL